MTQRTDHNTVVQVGRADQISPLYSIQKHSSCNINESWPRTPEGQTNE